MWVSAYLQLLLLITMARVYFGPPPKFERTMKAGSRPFFVLKPFQLVLTPIPNRFHLPLQNQANNRVTCHCHLVGWLWSLDRKIERG
jgi:hypothetical protein